MGELDADRTLALAYVPIRARRAVQALWRLDAALGAVLAGGREPLISRIKLAWWRDSLERLDSAMAPAEPVLQAIAGEVLCFGVSGAELSRMEEGWTLLLSEEPLQASELAGYAAARGGLLFRHSARILGTAPSRQMEQAGEAWALVDLARHSNRDDAQAAMAAARARFEDLPRLRWPAPLRPLGMLCRLARRDAERGIDAVEPHGAPGRIWQMLRHRVSGR